MSNRYPSQCDSSKWPGICTNQRLIGCQLVDVHRAENARDCVLGYQSNYPNVPPVAVYDSATSLCAAATCAPVTSSNLQNDPNWTTYLFYESDNLNSNKTNGKVPENHVLNTQGSPGSTGYSVAMSNCQSKE